MRLITERGELDIPTDFAFTIEQNSPIFSNEGTQSIPVNIPATGRNLKVIDNPTRPARNAPFLKKLSAKLESGIIHKDGQLVIESAQNKFGIVAALMLNESELYSKIKDIKLSAIFEKIVRDDYSIDADPVTSWYNHIYNCMKGTAVDDFTAFPVAVNYDSENGYEILNAPDPASALDPWGLIYAARTLTSGEDEIDVPAGYGITAFLWMYRVIELIFAEYDYAVVDNPFSTAGSPLKKIVLLNNTADSICTGKLNYSDLVPDITVSEFIQFLSTKFGMHVYVSPEVRTVNIKQIETVLFEDQDLDLSQNIDGQIKIVYIDSQELDITSDTSLEGAAPAADTIFDLAKKYTAVTKVDEATWRSYAWGSLPAFKNHLIFRKATGEYWDIYFRRPNGDGPTNKKRLGSNYFRYFTNKFSANELKSNDVVPAMILHTLSVVNSVETNIVCPYIGQSRHRNTALLGTNENSECSLMICAFAGKAAEFSLPAFNTVYLAQAAAKYCLGTTQKYDNAGNLWTTMDLTITDMYQNFFKRWNSMLMNSTAEIECKVDYSPEVLLSIKMQKLKLINGQFYLTKSITYSISSKKIDYGTSKFCLVKKQNLVYTDPELPLQ